MARPENQEKVADFLQNERHALEMFESILRRNQTMSKDFIQELLKVHIMDFANMVQEVDSWDE